MDVDILVTIGKLVCQKSNYALQNCKYIDDKLEIALLKLSGIHSHEFINFQLTSSLVQEITIKRRLNLYRSVLVDPVHIIYIGVCLNSVLKL